MAVDSAPLAGFGDVLDVRVQRLPEKLLALIRPDLRIRHGVAESDGLVAHGAARLGATLLEFTCRGRLVCGPVLAVHLVVRELDDHLDIRVRGAFEFLDQALAVALVSLHAQLVLTDLHFKMLLGGF